jgi:predicted dehydrogenase/nucleoside-diphosphate-sugar epimerase
MAHGPRRVGIVGAGYISAFHADALRALGIEVAGVADLDIRAAEALAGRLDAPAFGSLDALVDAVGPDAVHLCTPPQTHAALAERALQAGCDVFTEKPLATSLGDADRLVAVAVATGRRLGVGFNYLFADPYVTLRDALHRGRLGRVDHLDVVWHRPLAQLGGTSHRDWMLQEPANIWFEVGPHVLAHVVDLLGRPTRVLASRATDPVRLSSGAVFYRRWEVLAEAGAASVRLRLGLGEGYTEQYLQLRGTTGSAQVDLERGTVALHRERGHLEDLDRFAASATAASRQLVDSGRTLARAALEKVGVAEVGGAYGRSILAAVAAFHGEGGDDRIGPALGRDVVAAAHDLVAATEFDPAPAPTGDQAAGAAVDGHPTDRGLVLVLGATGFIGRHLVVPLRRAGFAVRCAVRHPASFPTQLTGPGVEVVYGDLADSDAMAAALHGVTHVVHLARGGGETWEELLRGDVEPTERFARLCAGRDLQRFVYASSIVHYQTGDRSRTITEDTPPDDRIGRASPYARSKIENERRLGAVRERTGLPLTVVRPGVVMGPGGDPRHWGVAAWPSRSVARLWGDGDDELPLVLVDDVASAIVAALVADGTVGRSFNLVAGGGVTARRYLERLAAVSGEAIIARAVPPWRWQLAALAKWAAKAAGGDRRKPRPRLADFTSRTFRSRFDAGAAAEVLGWRPERDPEVLLRRGVDEAVTSRSG